MDEETEHGTTESEAVDQQQACSPPEWLEDILEAINWTDGVDECRWGADKDGIITVTIDYGEETLSFRAGSDGDCHGVQYDGSIHAMTDAEQVQWWCAGELYTRLQKAKRKIEDLEAKSAKSIPR